MRFTIYDLRFRIGGKRPREFTIDDLGFRIGGKRLSAGYADGCRLGVRRPAEGDAALGMALEFGTRGRLGSHPQIESGVTATALQDASEWVCDVEVRGYS